MSGNGTRWLFLVSCLVALAAVVQDFRFDASSRLADLSATTLERESGVLRAKIAELRGGQTAYLATGQGPEFWMRRVTDLAVEIETGLGRLASDIATAEAQAQLATARNALADLLAIDKRARQALANDQRFLASDILFAEGLNSTQTLVDSVASATALEAAAIDARQSRQARLRLAMMPLALLFVIASAIVWAQSKPRETPASAAASMAQMLRDLPPPVKAPVLTAAVPAVVKPTPPAVDLAEAAELCVDMGRLLSADDIPALLGRAATVLNASGLVVWVAATAGDRLVPALSNGYSEKVIAKLGVLDPSADNLTSVCFRTLRAQSMPGVGQPGATSAIAVPMITADGCHGVLAAELPVARPAPEAVAVARMIAAQLAAMTAGAAESHAGSASASA